MSGARQSSIASRWSERRRRVAESEAEAEAAATAAVPPPPDEAELRANAEAAEAVDLSTIDARTDMSVFLKDGVSEILRKKALRQLWRSDPVFANIDRLNDYDENFADPARTVAVLQSAWQAGRGYLFPEDEPGGAADMPDRHASTDDAASDDEAITPADTIATAPDVPEAGPATTVAPEQGDGMVADAGSTEDERRERERPAHLSLRARLGV